MSAIDLLHRIERAISTQDIEAVVDCFSEDFDSVLPLHPARSFRGRDRVRASYEAMFNRFPDIRARLLDHATDGDKVWSEWEMYGTGPDGTAESIAGVVIFRMAEDGRATSNRFYLDPVNDGAVNPVTGA